MAAVYILAGIVFLIAAICAFIPVREQPLRQRPVNYHEMSLQDLRTEEDYWSNPDIISNCADPWRLEFRLHRIRKFIVRRLAESRGLDPHRAGATIRLATGAGHSPD